MQRHMLKSKIHRASVTGCDPDYVGSITIDPELMAQADILVNEQVHVWDIDNAARFVTYAILGEPGSGDMQVNGAAAHLVNEGDKIIVASFAAYDEADLETYSPVVVHVDHANKPVRIDSNPEVLLADIPSKTDEVPGALGGAAAGSGGGAGGGGLSGFSGGEAGSAGLDAGGSL